MVLEITMRVKLLNGCKCNEINQREKLTWKNTRKMAQIDMEIKLCSIHSSPAATQPLSWITPDKSKVFYEIKRKWETGKGKILVS